ncbi:MAG: rhomboid family intramembrane serine protease [bacterium]
MANYRRQGIFQGGFGGFLADTPVIRTILIANVAVYAFQMFFGGLRFSGISINDYIGHFFNLYPLGAPHQYFGDALGPVQFYPWQLVSYMFLHGGFTHLLFNMFGLWMFGTQIEMIWGARKVLTFYFLCGLGGALAHLFISPLLGGSGPLIGASGAIFGLLLAYGLLFPDQYVYFSFIIPMKAKYAIGIFVILELMSVGAADNIGHLAHLGGAVAGLIYLFATNGGTKIFSGFGSRKKSDDNAYWRSNTTAGNMFRRKPNDDDAVDAEYHDIGGTMTRAQSGVRIITQEDVDRILDKIAASGYQNLSEEEREILLEASRKMEKGN